MEGRSGRRAQNEVVFRQVNERIEDLQYVFVRETGQPLRIVCECDRLGCTEQFGVPLEVYERVRSDPSLFLIIPGHQDALVEAIVDSGPGYLIVRKRVRAEEFAEQSDPRG